ncbi:15502_t:CDS:2, partial [Racocetra persica]
KKGANHAEEIEINSHNKRYGNEFLEPLNMKGEELAKNIQVKKSVIRELLAEKRRMTVDLAYRLYFYFGVSAEYWLNFQKNYDLATYQELAEKEIKKQIQPYPREEKPNSKIIFNADKNPEQKINYLSEKLIKVESILKHPHSLLKRISEAGIEENSLKKHKRRCAIKRKRGGINPPLPGTPNAPRLLIRSLS